MQLNKWEYIYDDDYNDWDCKMMNQHAYSPLLKETNHKNAIEITLFCVEVIPLVFMLFILLSYNEKGKEEK